MANPKIEVEIGADLKGLQSGVAQSGKILSGIGSASSKASSGVNQLSRATSNYNGIGIEFSRIIQDAPFGIIGVGNNITQLAGSFQNLRAQSTSTGAALKTAFSSLISPANLLVLGISAVTTAFTLYSMGAFDAKDKTKDLVDELEKYRDTLDAVSLAQIKAGQNAEKESQSFGLLRAQAESANIPLEDRIDAVEELQKQYPKYLGNLTQEQILTGNVGSAYEDLAKSIIATAKARAFSDKIAENSLKILTLEQKAAELAAKGFSEETLKGFKNIQETARTVTGITGIGDQISQQTKAQNLLGFSYQDVVNTLKEQKEVQEQINQVKEEDKKLTNEINKQLEQGAVFTKRTVEGNESAFESFSKIADLLNSQLDTQESFIALETENAEKLKKVGEELIDVYDRLGAAILKQGSGKTTFDDQGNAITNGGQLGSFQELNVSLPSIAPQTDPTDGLGEKIAAEYDRIRSLTEQFNSDISNLIQNSIANTFADLGASIGEAIATGGNVLKAVGESLLRSLGNFLGELGYMMIQYGTMAIVKAKLDAAILVPGGGFIAGPLAIAAGVALVALSSAIGAKARGGGSSAGGGGSVGSSVSGQTFSGSGISDFNPNRELFGELVVRGNNLVYVLGETRTKIAKG